MTTEAASPRAPSGKLRHTARFSWSPICDQRAISSIERRHPSHQPLRASIVQTENHGDGTGERSARKVRRSNRRASLDCSL